MKRPIIYAAGIILAGGALYGLYNITMNSGPDPERIKKEVSKAIPELEEQGLTFANWELQDDNILVFEGIKATFDTPQRPLVLTADEARMTVTREGALRNRMNDFQARNIELSDAATGTVGLKAASASAPWIGMEEIEGKGMRPNYDEILLDDLIFTGNDLEGEMTLDSITFSDPQDGMPRLTVLKKGEFTDDTDTLAFESLNVSVRPERIDAYIQPDYERSESGIPEGLASFESITGTNLTIDTDDIQNLEIDDVVIETTLDDENYANALKITASGEAVLDESLEEGTEEYKLAQILVGPDAANSELSISASMDRDQGTMKVGPTRFGIADSFDVGLSGTLEGFALDTLEPNAEQQLENLMLQDISLDFDDQGVINRYLDTTSEEQGISRADLETTLITQMERTLQGPIGLESDTVEAITSFIRNPGQSGTLTITPHEPVPLLQAALTAIIFPGQLIEYTDIKVSVD